MSRYVNVKITRETKPTSEEGFGTLLILATSKALAYKEYKDLDALEVDFTNTTKEYKLASSFFSQEPTPLKVAVLGVVYDGGAGNPTTLTGALDELIKTQNDFYYLACVEQGDDEITALAKWIHKKDKIYIASTSNKTLPGTLKTESETNEETNKGDNLYDNVFILVHNKPETYPAEGLVGALSSMPFGSYTWTFKYIKGIEAVNYDDTEINELHNNNACTYINELGKNITSKGVTVIGEYADVIQSTHFLNSEITKNVFTLFANTPKVPLTNSGIALVVAEIQKAFDKAYSQGMIAEENGNPIYSITFPTRDQISKVDRANRLLPDIKWRAEIAGAIEGATINGTLSV